MMKILSIIFSFFIFIGCGGGGGGGSSPMPGISSNSLSQGQFIDAKVVGLEYKCSSGQSGVTNNEGAFRCPKDDNISFYAKGIYLGTSSNQKIISPYTLWQNNNSTAINVAQLLQTFDKNQTDQTKIILDTTPINEIINIKSPTLEQDLANLVGSRLVTSGIAQIALNNGINNFLVDYTLKIATFNKIKNKNTSENNITSNLEKLESYQEKVDGYKISATWSSSNTEFLENNGTIKRPTYAQGDKNVTLTLTAKFSDITKSKDFNLTIKYKPTTIESVNLDYNDLDFNDIKSLNTSTNLVFSDLNLPSSTNLGNQISWESNDSVHLTSTGIVHRPSIGSQDINVKLTATIYNQSYSKEKVFLLNIKALASDTDSDHDYIPDNIETFLGLDPTNNDENHNGIADGIDPDFGDTYYKYQWHLKARGNVVNNTNNISTIIGDDLGLDDVYREYMGYNNDNPIIISVVDNGTNINHEDLRDNIDISRSRNAVTGSHDPTPTGDQIHGTMVAGIIASRAFNDIGVRGVAPFAKIAADNWLSNQTYEELEKAWVTGEGANEIAVCNNSWGSAYDNDTIMESLLKVGATTLRDGKGRIYLKAAGNDRYYRGNSNLSNSSNNRYIIAVAALKHDNTHASYSSYGSNILVSGYSGEFYNTAPTIGTTTVEGDTSLPTWSEDTNHNYTYAMNGTSAATPTVSGCTALILEACPNLTYRDVKYIIAKTAKRVDSSNSSWVQNSAGLWHSIDYGYGLINTKGAIDMCKNGYKNLPQEKIATKTQSFNTTIPDNDETGVSFTIHIDDNFRVEWVGVYPNITHTYQGDLEILLTSPSGTTTKLVQYSNILRSEDRHYNGNGRLSSVAFVDENSSGDWIVTIKDMVAQDEGTLNNIKLEIVGH